MRRDNLSGTKCPRNNFDDDDEQPISSKHCSTKSPLFSSTNVSFSSRLQRNNEFQLRPQIHHHYRPPNQQKRGGWLYIETSNAHKNK